MEVVRQTFNKAERLRSRKLIEQVLRDGKYVSAGSLRMKWLATELDSSSPAQIAITVSKKKFKRAVDRNRIKRLHREVYRKNKALLYKTLQDHKKQLALLLIYYGNEMPVYDQVNKDLTLILQKLEQVLLRSGQ